MANYVVSDASLSAVADAIRSKGGTSEELAFQADFVQAIEDIETGGGGEVLLASGEYTLASDVSADPIQVPVSVNGKVTRYLLVRDSVATGKAHSYAWYRATRAGVPDEVNAPFLDGYYCTLRCLKSNGSQELYSMTSGAYYLAFLNSNTDPTRLTFRPYSSSFPVKAGTYLWYIWGEAST